LAKPNYQYEKRQKDLAKKKKQEEKRLRKLNKTDTQPQESADPAPGDGGTPPSDVPV
jgi:hypothetical protein